MLGGEACGIRLSARKGLFRPRNVRPMSADTAFSGQSLAPVIGAGFFARHATGLHRFCRL